MHSAPSPRPTRRTAPHRSARGVPSPRRRRSRLQRATAALLAPVLFLTLGTPLAAEAQEHRESRPDGFGSGSEPLPRERVELDERDLPQFDDEGPLPEGARERVAEEALESLPADALRDREVEDALAEAAPATTPESAEAAALPTGEAKSAVEPSRISLPNAEGSIEGMGESFAPVLSSGTATFSVPIALPAGRAGVQPSLGLSYASTGGNSPVGVGWSLSTPFIVRQSDLGLPRYVDDPVGWTPEEDRFFYNGGQELVPVDDAAIADVDGSGDLYAGTEALPAEVGEGWQQYRARIEGGFLRFFRSPDFQRWIVQGKHGTRFDFGRLPSGEGPMDLDDTASLESELPAGEGRIYRWRLTRMSDAHGSTVYYRYRRDRGELYVEDVFYLSPASCAAGTVEATRACGQPLSDYGVRVHFDYEARPDVTSRYVSGWRIEQALRLRRVTVTAAESEVGQRYLVRRYHFRYQPAEASFHSLLSSVQVEGRPDTEAGSGAMERHVFALVREEDLGEPLVGRTLPAMTFGYTEAPSGPVPGFGGLANEVREVETSPNVSVDAARADLFDVNTDGLPDLVVTDPARYRTADGEPAVGVFFNGFRGDGEPAGRAAVFSDPVPVPMRGDLAGVLNLGSPNIVPMDVEGDGRSDLLHMPRRDRYGFFAPTRAPAAASEPNVAAQGWRFTYGEVDLGRGVDPRVDFVRDGTHYKVWDVNGDHLIDVVRTTGTAMQTWLNLGWTPGGEGRFGQARWTGAEWALSTEPYETCLLHDGLPVDFADPELRLADMNGDGLTDLVKLRRGRVHWWPGRGTTADGAPVFGDGPAVCDRGDGAGRYREMATPPRELNPELRGVFLSDVNADGAADVVQVRFDEVDVWFNRAGEGFTERAIIDAPMAPDFAPRIRFADVDGSATTDLVYANAGRWEYIDLLGGQRPRLLTTVENGLGATTTLTYGSSAEDYVADLEEAATCTDCDEVFTWNAPADGCDQVFDDLTDGDPERYRPGAGVCVARSGGSPVVSTVVRSVSTTDNFDALRGPGGANVTETRFAYHDGYYEGIEQEFRGFGAADAVAVGDAHHPTAITRTHFHQGRRPTALATDRLADNPYEALKGRQWLSEAFDESGTFLSSSHATLAVRHLATGLDGRGLWYAYVRQSDELRYDNDPDSAGSAPGTMTLELPSVVMEAVGEGGAIPTEQTVVRTRRVAVRHAGYAHMRSDITGVDNLGQVRSQVAWGRVYDTEDPRGDASNPAPGAYGETIQSETRPYLANRAAWTWRTRHQWIEGGPDAGTSSGRLGWTTLDYTSRGDQRSSRTRAYRHDVPEYAFGGDALGAEAFSVADAYGTFFEGHDQQYVDSGSNYDLWGNPTRSCAGHRHTDQPAQCLRWAAVEYDAAYAQLPVREAIAVHPGSAPYCDADSPSSYFCTLSTTATWDRGFGVLLTATDPNADATTVEYDGLGRLSAVFPPALASDECGSSTPNQVFRYELGVDGLPVSMVATASPRPEGCTSLEVESRSYVDGLGRVRAALTRSDNANGSTVGSRRWIKSGVTEFTRRGTPFRAHDSVWVYPDPPDPFDAVALPSSPYVQTVHDAFGRAVRATERDGSVSETRYRALSTVAWDPLDGNQPGPNGPRDDWEVFAGTPSIARVDGHGRAIDQVLHQRQPDGPRDGSGDQYFRLFTTYRADGAVLSVTRAETSSPAATDRAPVDGHTLTRSFVYDSVGRRLGGTDPDSDARSGPAESRGWRYLFNRVGDLVAMRDPRGCGQNFYYDWAGRLLAEDYVQCDEAQPSGDDPDEALPQHAIGLDVVASPTARPVDARYHFDALPAWAGAFPAPPSAANYRGRLTGSSDRGQRSLVDYDDRGRPTWSARQMAVLPAAGPVAEVLSGDAPGVLTDDAPVDDMRLFDEAHTYVSTVTYNRNDEVLTRTYPEDPDWATMGGTGAFPGVSGRMQYSAYLRLPRDAFVSVGGAEHRVLRAHYDLHLRNWRTWFGGVDTSTASFRVDTGYDVRHRPISSFAVRHSPTSGTAPSLSAVTRPFDYRYTWDAASNLTEIEDVASPSQFPSHQRPARQEILHDALYRVARIDYSYRNNVEWGLTDIPAQDWRAVQATHRSVDPMRRDPAPMLPEQAPERPISMTYRYDWLANQVEWTDDASNFYERSLGAEGQVVSGFGEQRAGTDARPTALYLATNLPGSPPAETSTALDRGGWVSLDYGASGNVEAMTTRARCHDVDATTACYDTLGSDLDARHDHLVAHCRCDAEQHYQYRWDELNRLVEARRYDRSGSGDWTLEVRQRYRYDAGNVRTVKETHDGFSPGDGLDGLGGIERVALYVLPGDMERRGLVVNRVDGTYDASPALGTETQYLVGGARVVWKPGAVGDGATGFERDARITVALPNLIQSTSAVIDLVSGELLERSTFYPNGARETLRANEDVEAFALEPVGFTGKEGDDEVGLVYFGERYLLPHLGRWASPDPLQVHAGGGGEFGNSYHYISGHLLQSRDPLGLCEPHCGAQTMNGQREVAARNAGLEDPRTQQSNGTDAPSAESADRGVAEALYEWAMDGLTFGWSARFDLMQRTHELIVKLQSGRITAQDALDIVQVIEEWKGQLSSPMEGDGGRTARAIADNTNAALHSDNERVRAKAATQLLMTMGSAVLAAVGLGRGAARARQSRVGWTREYGEGYDRVFRRPGAGRPNSSSGYSVVFEVRLRGDGVDFPGQSRRHHFRESNRALHEAFEADPEYAEAMESLYPGIRDHVAPGPRDGFADKPPKDLSWHHHPDRPGVMQLIPRAHHQAPGPVQHSLHPGQRGGMENWGGGS